MASTLYLLAIPDADRIPDRLDLPGDGRQLAPGIYCIASDLSRSKLYHRIKWQLPEGTPLACAPLGDDPAGWPKFKGMEPGALGWLRGG